MAKITRALQKIFGSSATAGQIGVFGSLAAGSPATTTNPETVQSLSNYLGGWFSGILGGNSPALEDWNALCYLYSYQLAYLMQEGVAEWNTDTVYYIGSLVNSAGALYVSLTDTNSGNAVTNTTNWRLLLGKKTAAKTSAYPVVATDDVLFGSGSAFTFTLPAATTVPGKVYTFQKTDSTLANIITVSDGGSYSTTLNTQNEEISVISNGTAWSTLSRAIPSPWNSFSMTVNGSSSNPTKGTTSIDAAQWRREGNSIRVRWAYQQTAAGAAGTGDYKLVLPSSLAIDTSVLPVNTNGFYICGSSFLQIGATQDGTTATITHGRVFSYDSTSLGVAYNTSSAGNLLATGSVLGPSRGNDFSASKLVISIDALIPISGWNS